MWAVYKLQIRSSLRNPASLFNFIMPTIILSVLGTTMGRLDAVVYTNLVNNVVVMGMMTALLLSFGFSLYEMKKSVIMKRIGSTSITKPKVMLAFFAYAITVGYLSIAWTLFLAQVFAWGGVVAGLQGSSFGARNNGFLWSSINWGYWIMGLLIGTILSLTVAFFFISISPSVDIFNMFTTVYFMMNMFIGGLFLPASSIAGWMTDISYVLPHTYIMHIFSGSMDTTGWLSGSMNAGTNPFSGQAIFITTHPFADIFAPLAFAGLFAGFGIKNFTWEG